MFTFALKHVVRRSQKFDVADYETGFFEDFAGGGRGEGFAVFKVAAWTLECACVIYEKGYRKEILVRTVVR
jgi:hypothetical protein